MSLKIFTAPWVLPIIREPISDGAIAVKEDKILAVGPQKEILSRFPGEVQKFPQSVLMPALVNAHVHLELSGLRGQVPGDGAFVSWVERLIQLKKTEELKAEDITAAIEEASNSGTGLVGEVSNSGLSYRLLSQSKLYATFFLEVLSFQQEKARSTFTSAQKLLDTLPPSPRMLKTLSPHAPYTVSPALFALIKDYLTAHNLPGSFHLGESTEEVEFLLSGKGPLKALLERMDAGEPQWQAPYASPAGYWQALSPPPRMMLVHLTQGKEEDIKLLGRAGTPLCVCPRSNAHIGVGRPNLEAMLAAGLTPALGTDSLASNEDLNLFAEMNYLRKNFKVPVRSILKMATRWGAQNLGWGEVLGSLEPGKKASILAVEIQGKKPEEELLAGIGPRQIRWT